jgi:hypothetical protein
MNVIFGVMKMFWGLARVVVVVCGISGKPPG